MLVLEHIYFWGIVTGALFGLVLFVRRSANQTSNRFLALLLLSICLGLFDEYAFSAALYLKWPHLIGVFWPWTAVKLPALYLFFRYLAFTERIDKGVLIHFGLFAVYYVALVPVFLSDTTAKVDLISTETPYQYQVSQVFYAALAQTVQLVVYLILLVKLLRQHKAALQDQLANHEYVSLDWVYHLFAFFLLAALASMLGNLGAPWMAVSQQLMQGFYILALFYLLLRVFTQSPRTARIASHDMPGDKDLEPKAAGGRNSYETSKLDDKTRENFEKTLMAVMQSERPYLDHELSSFDLADMAGMRSHDLSQLLNTHFQQNFYEYVNGHRVQYACDVLQEDPKSNITALSYAAGFNSRSAFYRAFKLKTGVSPKEWVKTQSPTA